MDLTQLSLEQLSKLEVTSVSKKKQHLEDVAAAVYVITQQDIRSSGARNIPDLLRMVPGVSVAQLDANIWAISIRGFGDRFGDKVLVLIDGRSVYTPTSSGVYWDQQDVPLEDIQRIEVIRGPGGTVWGANAVNGVINIITKPAKDTQGGLVTAAAGSGEVAQGLIQYGGKVQNKGAYRIFSSYSNMGSLTSADGTTAADGWHISHGGFRSDWDLTSRDKLTVQGDLLATSEGETINVVLANELPQQPTFNTRTVVGAGNLLSRWSRNLSNTSDISLQGYYDAYNRHEEGGFEGRKTLDLDFQYHLALGSRNDVVWGLGYRVTADDITPKFSKSFVPPQRTENLFSTFAQDEIKITRRISLTLGSKFEHNAYTGFEYEPGVQLMWEPTKQQAFWASAARAIRQPARADSDIRIDVAPVPLDSGGFGLLERFGNPNRKAETLLAYQLGYRAQVKRSLTLDITAFLNFYHHLQTSEPGPSFLSSDFSPPIVVFPLISSDRGHAQSYGTEFFFHWNVTHWWQISPGFSYLHMNAQADPSSQDDLRGLDGDSPVHKLEARSTITLPHNLSWDCSLYHVDNLPDQGVNAYNRLDTQLRWRAGEYLEFSAVGQNLLTPLHSEFGDDTPLHTQIKRSVYGKATWRF